MTGVQLRLLLMTAKLVRRTLKLLADHHLMLGLHWQTIEPELDEAIRDVEQEEKNNPDRR